MDGHLKFEDFFFIALIVAAITIGAHWWFKKKCGCSSAVPRYVGPGQPPAAKRPGVTSCS